MCVAIISDELVIINFKFQRELVGWLASVRAVLTRVKKIPGAVWNRDEKLLQRSLRVNTEVRCTLPLLESKDRYNKTHRETSLSLYHDR